MKKLLFIDNTAHHLYTQQHLYTNFAKLGYKIILCAPNDNNYFIKMEQMGFKCQSIIMDGKGRNPLRELLLLIRLFRLYKKVQPDIIFSFTIKPNIYSAIISRFMSIVVVPNVTGLGYVFLKQSLLTQVVVKMYRFAFAKLKFIFFQNTDDSAIFKSLGILSKYNTVIQLPGSGVNLTKFPLVGYANADSTNIKLLYSGRLLWDKGLGELIDAYRSILVHYPKVKLYLIGNYFLANPAAITEEQIEKWQAELGVKYLGMVDNVADVIASSDCVILPSYREGMPRAILEASSMGKPVITTDVTGCRDAVIDGVTGYLCKLKDAEDLANKILQFLQLTFEQKRAIGLAGRKFMEQKFDQQLVVNEYMTVAQKL